MPPKLDDQETSRTLFAGVGLLLLAAALIARQMFV